MGHADELAERLREIEAAARGFDARDEKAAATIAGALLAIFQPADASPSLLSRLGATYVKVGSCVPKPPFPQDRFVPLTDVVVDLGSGAHSATTGQAAGYPPPRFQPRLGSPRGFRSVQAPDWWRNEPVMLVGHSRVTRRDAVSLLTLAATGSDDNPARSHLAELLVNAGWIGVRISPFGETVQDVPVYAAARAVVRQIAHEVLNSPELKKLAGQAAR